MSLRCPATTIRHGPKADDGISSILGFYRCLDVADHPGPHLARTESHIKRWSFADGSYSGLSESHPEFYVEYGDGANYQEYPG